MIRLYELKRNFPSLAKATVEPLHLQPAQGAHENVELFQGHPLEFEAILTKCSRKLSPNCGDNNNGLKTQLNKQLRTHVQDSRQDTTSLRVILENQKMQYLHHSDIPLPNYQSNRPSMFSFCPFQPIFIVETVNLHTISLQILLLLTVKVASRHAPASLKGRHNYF
jgi:hypothetical protein